MEKTKLKGTIFKLIKDNWEVLFKNKTFDKEKDIVQYSGAVFDYNEINSAIDVLLDGWFGLGNKGKIFENKMIEYINGKYCSVVNSGSSANLLSISALKSNKLVNPIKDGDEVITAMSGFPTTLNPIIQNNLVPVFIDAELGTYNIDINKVEEAISPKTRAIFVVHTLGNPVDMKVICEIANKYNLFVIEDCCDALGTEIYGNKVGSYGDLSTYSFYPAHHITMGEGGSVISFDEDIAKVVRSMRDWGRDCYCSGKTTMNKNGVCNNRFSKWLPELDIEIDHKYIYSEIGYNLKPIELQCAIGIHQFDKLPTFIKKRSENFNIYYEFFKKYEDFFIIPKWHEKAEVSWFGFPLTVKKSAPFDRFSIVSHLENHRIQTRNLFAGNFLYHPAYKNINFRSVGTYENADLITTNTFFIGVYPGICEEKINYILDIFESFIKNFK